MDPRWILLGLLAFLALVWLWEYRARRKSKRMDD